MSESVRRFFNTVATFARTWACLRTTHVLANVATIVMVAAWSRSTSADEPAGAPPKIEVVTNSIGMELR